MAIGHWERNCFGLLGVLLEDLKFEGEKLDELARHSIRCTLMTFNSRTQELTHVRNAALFFKSVTTCLSDSTRTGKNPPR